MRTDDLDYTLPPELIATAPAPRREDARLLVVRRDDPTAVEHRTVADLPRYISPDDAVTLNDTRVRRARLAGRRADTGGTVTGLFLSADPAAPHRWRVMLKAGSTLRPGYTVELTNPAGESAGAALTLESKDTAGVWTVTLNDPAATPDALDHLGRVPLPPYILQARAHAGGSADQPGDADRPGSVAAPTAGLHLTDALLTDLRAQGTRVRALTLHVGAGTFKPIESDTLDQHPMHAEWCDIPAGTLAAIDTARAAGGRSLAVGTTTARALESVPTHRTDAWTGETSILIAPGHTWARTDALLTNFHLPRSTLLAMVAALFPGGIDDLKPLYRTAIDARYRFYSFGDAMLILP